MLSIGFVLLLFAAQQQNIIQQISDSGRCDDLSDSPDARVSSQPVIAPGPPPLLSFRYYQGALHHRFGNSELMLDDAGH